MDFHPGSGFGSSFASNILPINHLAPYLNSGACPALLSVNVRPPTPLGIGDEIPPVINKYKKLSQNSPKVGVLYNHLTLEPPKYSNSNSPNLCFDFFNESATNNLRQILY